MPQVRPLITKKKTIGGKGGEAKKTSGINICTIRKQQYVNTVA